MKSNPPEPRAVVVLTGDLFVSTAQTVTNAINCRGVMGAGIALAFKERFPAMFEDYASRCAAHQVRLSQPYLFQEPSGPWILNFPTKDHWRERSRLPDIERGLDYLAQHYREWGITSLAVPALGCGHGGLRWDAVGPLLYRHFSGYQIPVTLYAPANTSPIQLTREFLLARDHGSQATRGMRKAASRKEHKD